MDWMIKSGWVYRDGSRMLQGTDLWSEHSTPVSHRLKWLDSIRVSSVTDHVLTGLKRSLGWFGGSSVHPETRRIYPGVRVLTPSGVTFALPVGEDLIELRCMAADGRVYLVFQVPRPQGTSWRHAGRSTSRPISTSSSAAPFKQCKLNVDLG